MVIRQRRLRRVGQRPERQARRDRLAAVHPRPAGAVAPRRHPHRQLRIRPHLPLEQEVGIDPRIPRVAAGHGLDAMHHPRHRQPRPRPDAVVHARRPLLAQAHHELRHVARVDERHRIVGRPGRQHLAAAFDPHRPVREPVRQIARTHDQPRPYDERAIAKRRARLHLAPHLERTVLVADGRRIRIAGLVQLTVFPDPDRAPVGKRRQRAHEHVPVGALAQGGTCLAHPARQLGRVVDDDIPGAPLQRRIAVGRVPVADEFLDRREQRRVGLAPVEQRDLVAAGERVLDLVRPDEARAPEDEDAEGLAGSRRRLRYGRMRRHVERAIHSLPAQRPASQRRRLEKPPAVECHARSLRVAGSLHRIADARADHRPVPVRSRPVHVTGRAQRATPGRRRRA